MLNTVTIRHRAALRRYRGLTLLGMVVSVLVMLAGCWLLLSGQPWQFACCGMFGTPWLLHHRGNYRRVTRTLRLLGA